jgi:hypothetical protein
MMFNLENSGNVLSFLSVSMNLMMENLWREKSSRENIFKKSCFYKKIFSNCQQKNKINKRSHFFLGRAMKISFLKKLFLEKRHILKSPYLQNDPFKSKHLTQQWICSSDKRLETIKQWLRVRSLVHMYGKKLGWEGENLLCVSRMFFDTN